MKAITIKQPWATLIALGEKKLETRSWQTKHRGPLAIHAGKQIDIESCDYLPIKQALQKHGIESYKDLPTSVVLAIVDLIDCHKVPNEISPAGIVFGKKLEGNEVYFGNYSEGRYAWELANLKVFPEPLPAKGKLRLWEWNKEISI